MEKHEVYRRFLIDSQTQPKFGLDWFLSAIDKLREMRATKMDWLGMEMFLVDVLQSSLSDADKIRLLKEGIDAFTRRGHFSGQEYLDHPNAATYGGGGSSDDLNY